MEFLIETWPVLLAVGAGISAVVVFGGKLADLILKWSQVFQLRNNNNVQQLESSTSNCDISEIAQHISKSIYSAESKSLNDGNIRQFCLKKRAKILHIEKCYHYGMGIPNLLNFIYRFLDNAGLSHMFGKRLRFQPDHWTSHLSL